jgi:acetyl esterase/lipase
VPPQNKLYLKRLKSFILSNLDLAIIVINLYNFCHRRYPLEWKQCFARNYIDMSSNSDRSFTAKPSEATPDSGAIAPTSQHQPMQIYRPAPSPLPGNRPVADNTSNNDDELLGYLD